MNEEKESVISGQGAVKEETAENNKSETRNQREQLSKAGSHGKVAEELHKNEEGRIKKDETLPPCLEIMKRVMERSREKNDDFLTFTIAEMEFLAADPLFARIDPVMAKDIRKILEAGPPG